MEPANHKAALDNEKRANVEDDEQDIVPNLTTSPSAIPLWAIAHRRPYTGDSEGTRNFLFYIDLTVTSIHTPPADPVNAPPPSFAQSEFETVSRNYIYTPSLLISSELQIVRRQRNNQPHTLKVPDIPSRFPNLDNLWEFAVSGSTVIIPLTSKYFPGMGLHVLPRNYG